MPAAVHIWPVGLGVRSTLLRLRRSAARLAGRAGQEVADHRTDAAQKVADARDRQLAEQQRTIEKLTRRAERAEAIIEVQKKLSRLLGIALPPTDEESE
jgi:hypothetical protein